MERDAIEKRAGSLAEELESVHKSCADRPQDEQRSRLRQKLEDSFSGLADEDAQRVAQAVRDSLIRDARDRAQRVDDLEAQVSQLQADIESMTAERDRLAAQVQAATGAAAPVAAPVASGDDTLGKLREALILVTKKKEVSDEALGLPPSEIRMFRMIEALLSFAISYTEAADELRKTYGIGFVESLNTQQWEEWIKQLRMRFRACLDNEEGSMRELQELLNRNAAFFVHLNKAYTGSIYNGCQLMLGVLEPNEILQQHKRALGHNFEKTFNSIQDIHNDLSNLDGTALWNQYFLESFRDRISKALGE